jgi:hypothetical protein
LEVAVGSEAKREAERTEWGRWDERGEEAVRKAKAERRT